MGKTSPPESPGPDTIVHQDVVYALDSPIQVTSLLLNRKDGRPVLVIQDGDYVVL